ncbi:MAG: Asp-tRNA(Asn)/Glu-tRNA(Gln) amidotransferase subunit GatA [Candidatus Pacebacteria bacterium]|nr:Asp-tRNA(Asn)/Glu-tRNA(Gln) amidotransferase subunit GatA [Candidatus Paceibacterota bacterium]MDD3072108.1 Asp-tRNA(Asn)/Glu-tRNA(Gln) amidotransferase subunit GatA [Candidatus Paceibacterota bacterium]MDD3728827.1 Asp-tRNA(Asn)/Glu-tRNA(Gln) amidotransferase subunit GatA [Candidatus Paceibacterota bacterium]MDD4201314.1 Asp-tRNA(Asn)/Glu-tRNA(Gln) amidotransferase subunit GatA [Candidatus Paceibacterota bacterium]MDD4466986.1 Asp-tRNA(Asn)/Glu-tRNA(Gln) amidotransferase subunit GatA [Candi
MEDFTISELYRKLRDKDISALEVAKKYIDRIKEEDNNIGAFLSFDEERAISSAKLADKEISEGKGSLLTGIPFALKDNILVEDLKNTCASKILKDYIAPYDATCFKKLKEKGAVLLGKTNLDEFAMGASTENSAFSITKNPKDKERVPGGSSGGSAAAVSSNMCVFALGSDTGGSIRQPASFCSVVGLKPTYGAVSRYGLTAFASSLDQIGPLSKNVEDAKIVFNVIKGKDINDSTSVDYKKREEKKNLKIGLPKEYFADGLDKEIERLISKEIEKIKKLGFEIKEISLPNTKYVIPVYYLTSSPEASSNLSRFDGIKYGLSIQGEKTNNLFDVYSKTREEGFGDEVKRRIILGTYALSSGYYDAYYLKAQKVRTLIARDFDNAFKDVDIIISPVSPFSAFKIGEKKDDPLSMYLCDILTAPVSLAGLPALSLPLKVNDLPVGLQIIGRHFEEENIFKFAKILEENE